MIEALLISLSLVILVLILALARLARRVRDLTISVECLCTNLGGLRQQIGHGGHEHAA